MDCGGKEPYFRARKRDPTASRVTRATIHKELACDSKEGTCVATAFWQSSPVIYSMQGLRAKVYFEFTLSIHY
jgi:hypothetical protein